MRCLFSFKAIMPALVMMFSVSANADNMKVMLAKYELGNALTKLGLLTDSFTERGKQSPSIAGANAAEEMASTLDQFIANGLQHNASCEKIQEVANSKIAEMYEGQAKDSSGAVKKAIGGVKGAMRNYVETQCSNLSE
ncbi:hypothetical protein ACP3S8_18085 [Mixta calida]|uniref:hypothetical protein n=1 Tax=Mixta calida TaxID=665913 RepID=UPI003CF4AB58